MQKSQHLFSKLSLEHNHEQENEMIKGDGGAVGLTESLAALRRWMIAGPEIARAVREFESAYDVRKPDDTRHHEQVPSVQKAFAKDIEALISVIEEMGTHSVKTVPIFWYWTLRKSCIVALWKPFRLPKQWDGHCMTHL